MTNSWKVLGHDWAVENIEASLKANRLAHAYLVTGVHGIGKTTFARALAQRLQCTSANPPCGVCLACQKIARGVHPDVRIIEGVPAGWKTDKEGAPPARSNDREKRTIKVDQIRELTHSLSQAPFEGKWKIVVLRRFEEANDEAANAFLKTLEEPPAHTLLVLTAQDPALLLPTIVSRCQIIALRPLAISRVEQALIAQWQVAPERAALLAHLSNGRIGWAVRANADGKILAQRAGSLDALFAALGEGRAERLNRAGELSKEGADVPQVLEEWLGWWRDVLLLQNESESGAHITNVDRLEALHRHAQKYSSAQSHHSLRAIRTTQKNLDQNSNLRLALEVLMLELPR